MAVDGGAATASANAAADAAVASSLSGPKLVKRAGGRSKRVDPEIVIHTDQRKGRKQVTIVVGLDLFDIKLSDAAKACKKAFASGATVAKVRVGGAGCLWFARGRSSASAIGTVACGLVPLEVSGQCFPLGVESVDCRHPYQML